MSLHYIASHTYPVLTAKMQRPLNESKDKNTDFYVFLVQSGGARLNHYQNVQTYTGPATITMGLGEFFTSVCC